MVVHEGPLYSIRDLARRWNMSPQGAERYVAGFDARGKTAAGRIWDEGQVALVEERYPALKGRGGDE